ncbi:MAG: GyrI-like domain-containing protein [Oscillospiraceae bacterium]|nr:GyrI-like domain-containing protein [Oscillospiraceae bacterium]
MLERKFSEYDMIFLLLDGEDDYDGKTHEIPQQTCVTLRFRGSHNEAAAQYEKLLSFIDEHNLKISGNSSEITMIDYGFTNDTSKFVTEIQIPVVF